MSIVPVHGGSTFRYSTAQHGTAVGSSRPPSLRVGLYHFILLASRCIQPVQRVLPACASQPRQQLTATLTHSSLTTAWCSARPKPSSSRLKSSVLRQGWGGVGWWGRAGEEGKERRGRRQETDEALLMQWTGMGLKNQSRADLQPLAILL